MFNAIAAFNNLATVLSHVVANAGYDAQTKEGLQKHLDRAVDLLNSEKASVVDAVGRAADEGQEALRIGLEGATHAAEGPLASVLGPITDHLTEAALDYARGLLNSYGGKVEHAVAALFHIKGYEPPAPVVVAEPASPQ